MLRDLEKVDVEEDDEEEEEDDEDDEENDLNIARIENS